jgi:hypothetical protein
MSSFLQQLCANKFKVKCLFPKLYDQSYASMQREYERLLLCSESTSLLEVCSLRLARAWIGMSRLDWCELSWIGVGCHELAWACIVMIGLD